MRCTAIWCTGLEETQEKKTTANRRESRPSGEANRICGSSLSLVRPSRKSIDLLGPTARPFIGTVRANPVAAPAAPVRNIQSVILRQKKVLLKYNLKMREIAVGRRWGADRICPNVPDEG